MTDYGFLSLIPPNSSHISGDQNQAGNFFPSIGYYHWLDHHQ